MGQPKTWLRTKQPLGSLAATIGWRKQENAMHGNLPFTFLSASADRISRSSFLYVSSFGAGDLGQRASRRYRPGRGFRDVFIRNITVAVLDQQPIACSRPHQHPGTL